MQFGEELFMESMGPHTYSSIPESDTFRLQMLESFLADRGITGGGGGGTGGGSEVPIQPVKVGEP